MNNFLKYSLAVFLISLSFNAYAEEKLDETQLIKLLLQKNKKVISDKEKLNISDAEIIKAGIIPNQSMILDFSPPQQTYRVGVGNVIELGDKRNLRINLAKQKKQLEQFSFLIEVRELKFNALKVFYNIIYLRKKQNKYNELINLSNENLNISQKKYEAGDIPKLDVDNMQLKNLILKNEMIKNSAEITLYQNSLNNMLNTDTSKLNFIEEKNNICIKDLLKFEKPRLTSLELLELNQKLETINSEEKLVLENIKPDINLNYGLDTITNDLKVSFGPFISASLELDTAKRQQGNLYEIDRTRDFLEKEKDRLNNNLEYEWKSSIGSLNSNNQIIKQYDESLLPNLKENLKKSQISFKEGKSNIFNLLLAQQNLIDSEIELLNINSNYQQEILELKRLGGCL